MNKRPTEQEAAEAENYLESTILQFSEEARAPWERGKPNPHPTWVPKRSTLRFSPLRRGGWIWTMDANDSQIVAYYVVPSTGEAFGKVTGHGQARHNFHLTLESRHIYPTASPYPEWYDFRTQYALNDKMNVERRAAREE